ncbi:GAK system XXXCH domain-containing protein [Maridesulfovibrio frigidus]|uniref:GAK system XXXCH domain-containing protein n=1 Tax=Maridesulfovibrio frigidus TaxID=340956 RepID=UPI0004E1FC9A|nr:GAK system XXXCH domain-containing protein [Maridesulfovibrio frigidus]
MGKGNKIERSIRPEELPNFLRQMADAIETGETDGMTYFTAIEGFKKLKIKISQDPEETLITVKVKPEKNYQPATQETQNTAQDQTKDSPPKTKYTELKKRMKNSFKTIFKSIHAGVLPPERIAAQFIEDSKLMVTYEGHGEDYYDEYAGACDEFVKALENKNIEDAHKACDNINSIKAHCHSQYK